MTLDKICMRIKRVGMEVLSILVFFSSPTNSSRMSDLKPATLRHGEREANSGSNGRETSSFLLLPVFWLFLFFFTNGFRWKDAQRRRRSMDTRKAILPHRSRNHSRSVSFHIQYPPSLWSALPTHTHITMVPYRAQLLGSRYGIFFQLKKFLLGFIFEWKCKTYKQKKQHTYRGALEIALDTSSTFSSIVWKLTNTKSSSQNYSGAKDWKKPSMKIKAKFEQQLNG